MIRKLVKDIDLLTKLSLLDPRNCLKTEDVIRQHALLPPETSAIWLSPENIRVSSFRNTTPKLAALLNTCKSQMAQIYDGTGEHISEHLMIY